MDSPVTPRVCASTEARASECKPHQRAQCAIVDLPPVAEGRPIHHLGAAGCGPNVSRQSVDLGADPTARAGLPRSSLGGRPVWLDAFFRRGLYIGSLSSPCAVRRRHCSSGWGGLPGGRPEARGRSVIAERVVNSSGGSRTAWRRRDADSAQEPGGDRRPKRNFNDPICKPSHGLRVAVSPLRPSTGPPVSTGGRSAGSRVAAWGPFNAAGHCPPRRPDSPLHAVAERRRTLAETQGPSRSQSLKAGKSGIVNRKWFSEKGVGSRAPRPFALSRRPSLDKTPGGTFRPVCVTRDERRT